MFNAETGIPNRGVASNDAALIIDLLSVLDTAEKRPTNSTNSSFLPTHGDTARYSHNDAFNALA